MKMRFQRINAKRRAGLTTAPSPHARPYPFEISSVFGASTERTEELLIILSRSLHRDVLLSLFTHPWLPVGSESRERNNGSTNLNKLTTKFSFNEDTIFIYFYLKR